MSVPVHVGEPGLDPPSITTVGQLRDSGYRPRTVKQELRENTLGRLAAGQDLFPGLVGYDQTVIPQIAAALLSRHDLLLLGLRGQAKTRLLRSMVGLLDEWMPVLGGPRVELHDDPLAPRTSAGRTALAATGADTPIAWVHRSRRYLEKLATPDVTVADLIGEIDLVKHAEGRYLADESTIHFGLIPRASRGIFVINELPDLSPRIQVALFNVLEERDVQIRGYPVRLDLDVSLMFSANPEDYTNRGRIVTPLKDRLGSVVRTHYPADNADAVRITVENAYLDRTADGRVAAVQRQERPARAGARSDWCPVPAAPVPAVEAPPVIHEIVEEMIRLARHSPHVNQASGVSVRASMAAMENVVSSAEIRAVRTGEARVMARVCDLAHVLAACRGKIELMLAEDAPDRHGKSTEDRLIEALLGEAVKGVLGRSITLAQAQAVSEAFAGGLRLELGDAVSAADALASMRLVDGLLPAADRLAKALGLSAADDQARACCGELVLEFLYVNNRLSKSGWSYTR